MERENNLIRWENLTPEEQFESVSRAGKASAAARRRRKSMRQVMEMLLSLPAGATADYNTIADAGIDVKDLGEETVNNVIVVMAALLKNAKAGDVASIKELRSIIQEEILMKHKIKNDNARLELERKKLELPTPEPISYAGIPALMIAPTFAPVHFDVQERTHSEYVFPGGRGSTKSSFVSMEVIDLLMHYEQMHAVVLRQVADTLRGSVYQQIIWAISALGLDDEFNCTVSPLEITRRSTGQKIYFRGADDPGKIKSIKVPFGYIGIVWFEELDQFSGEESVRKIEQSVIRGGDMAFKFKTFNPPKSANNWANQYIKIPREDRLVTESNYLTVPPKWLGKPFLDDAEFLKATNPIAYENEYLGVANGVGGNVFDNVLVREISDEELAQFDRIYRGVDWGWYPDPFAYVAMYYDAARLRLVIFDEYRCNKQSNAQTAEALKRRGVGKNTMVICDSAENKSIGDYCEAGIFARPAAKGPGSVEYGMKWLQSLNEIVIDNRRCPETTREFLEYEYARDKEGNVITGYPDANNHSIDAVRYALEDVIRNVRVR